MARSRSVRLRAAVVVTALAAATIAPVAAAAAPGHRGPRPSVVVAVPDTGVNPYHSAFYRPQNTAHPCTWVKGFTDCSIPALRLSVGKHADLRTALAADRAVWDAVKPHQWYWIPRTNIIGAVCDLLVADDNVWETIFPPDPPRCVFDESGHGTGTASSVLSEAPDALLLVHEGNTSAEDMATAPVVPDLWSHSWGSATHPLPAPLQAARPVAEDPCPVGQAGPSTLVFLAAGNVAPTPAVLDCQRTRPEIQVVGGGYPGYWKPDSWTTYDFASWFCRPTARHVAVGGTERSCGTSFSAPTAAGAAAAALLRIRQHDRYAGRSTPARVSPSVTRERFVDALRTAATYAPEPRFPEYVPCSDPTAPCGRPEAYGGPWAPLPPNAPHLAWGYGWLDATVSDAVVACSLGRRCPAKPQDARDYNERRQEARHAAGLYGLGSASDDAGSRRDAGPDATTAIPVAPGRTYRGRLDTLRAPFDWEDGYALRARAGQALSIAVEAAVQPGAPASPAAIAGCWVVVGPDGKRLTPPTPDENLPCDGTQPAEPAGMTLPRTGTYLLLYRTAQYLPHDYRFAVSLSR